MNEMYERIEELCHQHGVSMTSMCRQLKISRSILSELRSGRTKELSIHNLRKIADFFSVPVDVISHNAQQSPDNLPLSASEEYFNALYHAAKDLNEENRQKLLDLAKMFRLAQKAEEVTQLSFLQP